jgi:EAL domain-containing protein (putative c-di-GMP-specific phosphodiesterase class I)
MPDKTLLDAVLAPGGLSVLFQPIYAIKNQTLTLHALEALSRGPAGTNVHRADVLFEYARRKGAEAELDRVCIALALREVATLPTQPVVSLNVHASTLERDNDFPRFLFDTCAAVSIDPSRLILELIEQQRFWDKGRFLRTLVELRRAGVQIALDDVGLGYSNHRLMAEIHPDIVKVDRYFVNGSRGNDAILAAIESIVVLAGRLHSKVIAEGIETLADLRRVCSLGIDLVQGYLFARPLSARCVVQRLSERTSTLVN